MEENIFLIGFMGAGKSTVARALSERYGMGLIEMDEQIEKEEGRPISRIFAEDGEGYFRTLETRLLEGLSGKQNVAVSCGGGVPMRPENLEAMRKSGKIVFLSAEPETILARVRAFHTRPLLEGNMNLEYISGLLTERLPCYQAAADTVICTDGKTEQEICAEIQDFRERGGSTCVSPASGRYS